MNIPVHNVRDIFSMRINIHVTPNASRNEIVGKTENGGYKIKIQSPPVEGAANKNLIKFIAKTVGLSRSKVFIVKGLKSRNKIIEIDSDDEKIIQYMERTL